MKAVLAALCAALAAPAAASPLDLTFASAPPAALWTPYAEGSGPTFAFTDGRLELSFPAGSNGATFDAGVRTACALAGDFEISLEYVLLDWPLSNGVRSGIIVGGSWNAGAVERTSFGTDADYPGYPREVYLTHMADGVQGITGTPDLAGKVRLVRTGDRLTGAYATVDGWAPIHEGPIETGELTIALQAWSHDYAFTGRPVRLAFTSFEVVSGQVRCGGSVLVPVDVKPGSAANPIKVTSQGVVPVAILGSDALDAALVDAASVTVADAPAVQTALEDVNGDGRLDLVVHAATSAMALPPGTTAIAVHGAIQGGGTFVGYDKVTLLP